MTFVYDFKYGRKRLSAFRTNYIKRNLFTLHYLGGQVEILLNFLMNLMNF